MQLTDAVTLIRDGVPVGNEGKTWADLGCGRGLFTQALAHLLPPGSTIHAVDKSPVAIDSFSALPGTAIRQHRFDFTTETGSLQNLDGIIMANSLHYVQNKIPVLRQWKQFMKSDGIFIVVEYDTERANPWVPFPVPFSALAGLLRDAGYGQIKKIGTLPSRYQSSGMYAAAIG